MLNSINDKFTCSKNECKSFNKTDKRVRTYMHTYITQYIIWHTDYQVLMCYAYTRNFYEVRNVMDPSKIRYQNVKYVFLWNIQLWCIHSSLIVSHCTTACISKYMFCTVAERDTAAAAQAALGPPKSRRWPPKSRPSAAAGRRGWAAPAKTLKSLFSSRMVNWTTVGVV